IKKDKEELITNFEVLSLLKHKRRIEGQVLLNEFVNNTVRYLETTPASKESVESVKKCRLEINKLATQNGSKIMKAELLQILNIAPSGEVEVHLIVEDCEDRLNPKELLRVVKDSLGDAVVREL
ncbi:hypothetical protein DICPUDRAFT_38395, partial [Dictyostelium purpureum]